MANVWLSLAFGGMNVTQIVQPREFVRLTALPDPDSNHRHDCRPGAIVDLSRLLSSNRRSDFSALVPLCPFSY